MVVEVLRAMKMALNNAKISSDQIDYINAHGTSTPLGDEIEFNAVKKIFLKIIKKFFSCHLRNHQPVIC